MTPLANNRTHQFAHPSQIAWHAALRWWLLPCCLMWLPALHGQQAPSQRAKPTALPAAGKSQTETRPVEDVQTGQRLQQPPVQEPNSQTLPAPTSEKSPPPAFGPGSPSYGKPFFYQPGAESIPIQPPAAPPTERPGPSPTITQIPVPESLAAPVVPGIMLPGVPSGGTPTVATEPTTAWLFRFQDAPWPTVLKHFARYSGLSLQIEQMPQGQFTYFDERSYTFPEALDILNDHLLRQGCLLVRNENKLTSITATNSFREGIVPFVPLRSIPLLGRNELVSVAFPVSNLGTPQALAEVQQILSPMGRVQALSNSNRLIVTDTGSSLRRLRDLLSGSGLAANETERIVIHLRNTRAELVASAVNQRLGGSIDPAQGQGVVPVSGANAALMQGTQPVVAELQTNCLLAEGTPDELARIESLVREIDRDPPQVVIQALLVEVLLGNAKETGVELGFQDSVLFDRSVIDNIVSVTQTTTAPNGVQTTNQNVVSQTASPGFNFNGSPLGNNVTVNPSSVGKQSVTNLGLGRVSGDLGFGGLVLSAGSNSVNVLLRALAEKHKVDVLSRPQVRTIDNREALIQIGQQVPVVDGVSLTPNGNANPIIRQDKAGIILRVTPRIAEDGLVQIDVQAEKSAYQLSPGSGVPIFTDATKGNVIEAPVKDITTAQTTVAALSGQTIVLGGMITRDQTDVERKVPFLGDLPLVGFLFRIDLHQTNRKELLIFLTPTVVNHAGESDCISAHEASRISLLPNPEIDLHRDFIRASDPASTRINPAFAAPPLEPVPEPGMIEESR